MRAAMYIVRLISHWCFHISNCTWTKTPPPPIDRHNEAEQEWNKIFSVEEETNLFRSAIQWHLMFSHLLTTEVQIELLHVIQHLAAWHASCKKRATIKVDRVRWKGAKWRQCFPVSAIIVFHSALSSQIPRASWVGAH